MSRKAFSLRFILGLLLVTLLSSCGGSSAATPPSTSAETQEAPAQATALAPENTPTPEIAETPEAIGAATPEPAIPERRLLTFEFPPKIRAGDSDIVRLTLAVDASGNITPTAVVNGNVVTGNTIEIPNLYDTHHVIAEARMDMAGVQISPPDLSSQTLLPGQSIMFFWSIRPTDIGLYRGTVWLYLRFVDKVSGEESRVAVSAQTVEIEAVNLLGLSGRTVRSVGAVGSVVGTVIGFPFFEDIVRYIFKRKKKRTK
jgi:hypothetical protein